MITVLAVAVTGILALVGFLFAETRDSAGRLTTAGWLTLLMLLASGALNLFSAVGSHRSSERIATDLRRGRYAVNSVTVTYAAVLPTDHIEFSRYQLRLSEILGEYLREYDWREKRDTVDIQVAGWAGNELRDLRLGPHSKGYPDKDEEPIVFQLLNSLQVGIDLYREPVPLADEKFARYQDGRDHLLASIEAFIPATPPVERTETTTLASNVSYDFRLGLWKIQTPRVVIPFSEWYPAPGQFSLLDLRGTSLVIDPFEANTVHINAEGFDEVRSQMRLLWIVIEFLPGRSIWLQEDDWIEHRTERGFPLYEARFPESEEDVLRMFGLH